MKTIGRYIIKGLLGRGGMGRVLKVELPVVGKIAALKILDPDPLLTRLIGFETLRRLFIREAATLARLQHPNIVSVNDFENQADVIYYVMDYYANNLGVLMGETYIVEEPSRRLGADKALFYTRQILEGLACLHDAGIIHRDIKPYNLLIAADDSIKICDFGLSRLRGERYAGPPNIKVGSPYYAAPEQMEDPDGVDPTVDLYAVGVILYRMLTGQLPMDKTIPPSRLHQDLDKQWDHFILKALAPEPAARFSDAVTMGKALDDLADHWQALKEKLCALPHLPPAAEPTQLTSAKEKSTLRSSPTKIAPKAARDQFGLDKLWRPAAYAQNQFSTPAPKIVHDHHPELIWQQGGSNYPVTWHQAQTYVDGLNREQYCGISHWRLPTTPELMTLLQPVAENVALCLPTLFAVRQQRLWSCDRRSFTAAYFVDATLGFVGWQDFSAPCYVRGVCAAIFSAI